MKYCIRIYYKGGFSYLWHRALPACSTAWRWPHLGRALGAWLDMSEPATPPEPTRPAVWPFKNFPGKAAHEPPYSEPPLPTFRPSDEDEALL